MAEICIWTRFGFCICIIFSSIVLGFYLNLKKLNHFTRICKRLQSQYETHCPDHNIQIKHQITIKCQYSVPGWPLSKRKSQDYLCASWCAWSINCSWGRLDRQNRKFAPFLVVTEAKNVFFFKCTRSGFVYQELRDFAKTTLTRVSSHWLRLESSQVILWKTWLGRVESPFFSTLLESSPSHEKSWLESTRVIDSSYTITAWNHSSWTWLMICGELEEFVHTGWATKWIYKVPVLLLSVRQQGTPRPLDQGMLAKEKRIWDFVKQILYTLIWFIQTGCYFLPSVSN